MFVGFHDAIEFGNYPIEVECCFVSDFLSAQVVE